jgi:predicted dehydrogenase
MVRLGIVGCNYGHSVLLPAFRNDPRCEVIALAGRQKDRVAALASAAGIPHATDRWQDLVAHPDVTAVAIATVPALQPAIARAALALGKPVFAEKPMAADLAGATAMAAAATASGRPTMMDFGFREILAWKHAHGLLAAGAIGRLRHVEVSWHVENYATRMRLKNWKSLAGEGGGALGNFVSHCFHYLEWFCGPIERLSARLSGLPDEPAIETHASIDLAFRSGAVGSIVMSSASYLGSGHRVAFYGEDGTLTLVNPTTDYMRGFELRLGQRPAAALAPVEVVDALDGQFPSDGRIAPAARLAAAFLDAIETGRPTAGGFASGLRVQALMDAARRANDRGEWLGVGPGEAESAT